MKTIEKPFAASAVAKLAEAETAYKLACKRYNDLKFIRDKVASGHMTPELYNFINMDGSLEQLFSGLPRPSEVACEALSTTQLEILDATIADEALNIKALLDSMWEAIKSWFMDWWDRNRYTKRHLQYLAAQLKNGYAPLGDRTTFAACQVSMYTRTEWLALVKACESINTKLRPLMKTKPEELEDAVVRARLSVETDLHEFGKYSDEAGNIKQGVAKYVMRENSCANLRWLYEEVENYLKAAITVMEDEIDIRKQLSDLEKLFKGGSPDSKKGFVFVKQLLFASKECNLHVGRTLRVMLNKIMRDQSSHYRVGNSVS